MKELGIKSKLEGLDALGIHTSEQVNWNLSPANLIEKSLDKKEGILTDTGALMCDTGKFTGRAPNDKYIVRDSTTENHVKQGINCGVLTPLPVLRSRKQYFFPPVLVQINRIVFIKIARQTVPDVWAQKENMYEIFPRRVRISLKPTKGAQSINKACRIVPIPRRQPVSSW